MSKKSTAPTLASTTPAVTKPPKKLTALIEEVRLAYDADLLVYSGAIMRPIDDLIIDDLASSESECKNILFWLTSRGGDPDAAYRMCRTLNQHYNEKRGGKVIVMVHSVCQSAGTLITLCADEIILMNHAELGPLDIQLMKHDEVDERTSGLTPLQAIEMLNSQTMRNYEQHFFNCRKNIGMPSRMAAEIAADLSNGVMSKLYEQLDPIRLAEVHRATQIVSEYAGRIKSENIKQNAVERLINDYPSHGFVIDPAEAAGVVFEDVSDAVEPLVELEARIGSRMRSDLYKTETRPIFFGEALPEDSTTTNTTEEI